MASPDSILTQLNQTLAQAWDLAKKEEVIIMDSSAFVASVQKTIDAVNAIQGAQQASDTAAQAVADAQTKLSAAQDAATQAAAGIPAAFQAARDARTAELAALAALFVSAGIDPAPIQAIDPSPAPTPAPVVTDPAPTPAPVTEPATEPAQ